MTTCKEAYELEETFRGADDDLKQYLQEIRQYPQLDAQQERLLAMRCAQGDEDAIHEMVNSNLRLVVSVVKKYAGQGVPLMDLIQEGNIGLLVAAKKFDYTLEYRFSTYATKWIQQSARRCVFNHGGVIRVPVHTAEQIKKLHAMQSDYQQKNGAPPPFSLLAAETGLTEEKVRQLLQLNPRMLSLDEPTGERENSKPEEFLEVEQMPEPLEALARRQMEATMSDLLKQLPPRQQEVLRLHFGLEDGVCQSLEKIGAQIGISKERARQIERQALDKLQKLGDAQGLGDYLD